MTTTDTSRRAREPRLLDRHHLPTVTGALALVTLAAFENRAVQTVLPVVVADLDGWGLFGASTGASLVAFTVALAFAGAWTDRLGPRPVLLAGLGTFAGAQVVAALAPTMAVFVAGRALSGAAEALVDTALMVVVAQALPEALRAKVFAGFAAAWVLPSLLGPGLAGGIEAVAGWRPVFAAPLAVALPALVLLHPALRGTGPRPGSAPGDDGARGRTTAALVLAAALDLATFSAPLLEDTRTRTAGVGLVLTGLVVAVAAAARALPRGTARLAPGVPAVVGLRLLVAASFSGVGAAIPLMLVTVHDASAVLAGVSLSVTGVMWAVGSWVNSTGPVQSRLGPTTRTRAGGVLIAVGALGPALLALDVVGLVPGMLGWALAATGMGVLSPTLSTELLALAPRAEQGRASAAQGLAVSTGVALQTGAVGTLVAWSGAGIGGRPFAALMLGGATLAGMVSLGAGRIRGTTADVLRP
ncbi:MFS transporter [Phycicoccus sp. CSK15P-2]|uniref:MFS transporter n=1 Tax=Phycicoccus sp. CSK15P-2 TaxID=2807627 RepID=UPI00194E64CF|nr:MFS transporter [Phycicoccus sp. CSK15P-2]MBM6404472.1 MFS transporter [Phycicoccus sp. CSK15P-2]